MPTQTSIKRIIASISKIRKISSALEIVALTRLKRMEQATVASRDYFQRVHQLLFDVSNNLNFRIHPFLNLRPNAKKICLIALFSDKGLCGNFNADIASKYREFVDKNKGKQIQVIVVGKKGERYIKKYHNSKIVDIYSSMSSETLTEGVGRIGQFLIKGFLSGGFDEVFLLYSKFKLQLLGHANLLKLLPFSIDEKESKSIKRDYIYDSSPEAIFTALVRHYVANQVHQGILESRCAEEMSRMLAMKAATENSDEMIEKLRLVFNKNRQAQITKELTEVISAVEAAG
ncbi:MAG: ATP synthase F1 subunit gamma [Candidatus Omnitrophota bacterium]